MWCSWVSSSSGSLWPTWRISTLVIARPPSCVLLLLRSGPDGPARPARHRCTRPHDLARSSSSSELPLVVGERRHRLVVVQGQDPLADQLDVEQRPDAEPGAVGGDPTDEADRSAAEHAEAHVV